METKNKNKGIKRPAARSLKIHPKYRINRWSSGDVPELILCGRWLEELGFKNESRVEIHTFKGLIVIRPEGEQ